MIGIRKIKKGDVFFANLDPTIGCEQKGIRPVVVIQNNVGNRFSPTLIIAPLTSKTPITNDLPTHVVLLESDGLLKHDSVVLLEQIRVIDRNRLQFYIGSLTKNEINKVDNAILVSFGIKN